MKKVAESIGDLHYEILAELLLQLHTKIGRDGQKDWDKGRFELAKSLLSAQTHLEIAYMKMRDAWQISKPYMSTKGNDHKPK